MGIESEMHRRDREIRDLKDENARLIKKWCDDAELMHRYKEALEDIVAIEERRNRGDAETSFRAKKALKP